MKSSAYVYKQICLQLIKWFQFEGGWRLEKQECVANFLEIKLPVTEYYHLIEQMVYIKVLI